MSAASAGSASNHKLVQMRLLPATIVRVKELERWLGSKTRTDAVKASIDIAHLVVQAMLEGKTVIIEDKAGARAQILIPGISGSQETLR